MVRHTIAAFVALLVVGTASAQAPARLKWQTGQVLLYKVEQTIAVAEVVGDKKVETTIKLNHTKRWQVVAVDANGVATIQHSLVALRHETTTADGGVVLFDSANLDKSTPELKNKMGKFVGPTLAVLRVDGLGRVVEVKESKFGGAGRYEGELPFVGVLPTAPLQAGLMWERNYNLTVGTDEKAPKVAAVQHFTCKGASDSTAMITLTTEFKSVPEAIEERVRLLQMQPEGELIYDLANGRLHAATLKIDKELKNYQGEGSSIRVTGMYVEKYAGDR